MACRLVGSKPIIWTNAGILLIGPLGKNFSEFSIQIYEFSLKNAFGTVTWKMAATFSRPQCVKKIFTLRIKFHSGWFLIFQLTTVRHWFMWWFCTKKAPSHCLKQVMTGLTVWSWWLHQMETFPHYWPFVRGIHWSPVNSPHKGQWRRALMFSLICVWINGWVNNREAGDLRRYCAHYDITLMVYICITRPQ